MRIGTVVGTVEQVEHFRAAGYHFVGLASDLGLYMRAATGALQALRTRAAKTVEGGY
jgi:hypothetical protein